MSAAVARIKTTTTNNHKNHMPHIIPGIISFIMAHLS
jgi:hypothetical protein